MSKINKCFHNWKWFLLLFCFFGKPYTVQGKVEKEGISIFLEKKTLREAFKVLEDKYYYVISYDHTKVDDKKTVSVSLKDSGIKKVMDNILNNTTYSYEIIDKNIIIKKAKKKPAPKKVYKKITVTGVIKDKKGEPVPFATVQEKNTTNGMSTDMDGKYSLKVFENSTITFSCIGYESIDISVKGRTSLNAVLQESSVSLDQIVVTGYQKIDRKLFTGSAEKISAKDSKVDGVVDVSRMLEGKVAGVSVQNVSGTFGAAPKVRVRGASSIYGDTKPLWVVDGVVLEDVVDVSPDELSSGDAETLISSSVAGINADDIESFQILKDASATALYGARAMNGVIVINTKRGKSGKVTINYTGETTIRLKPSYSDYDILNSQDQMSIFQELERKGWLNYANMATVRNGGIYYKMYNDIATYDESTGEFLLKNKTADKIDYLRYYELQNTDWFDHLFKNSVMQNHSLSMSGGSETSRYYASISYLNDPGWTIADNVDRYTMKMNGDFSLTKKLSVGIQSNLSVRNQRIPGTFGRSEDRVSGQMSRDFDINPFSYALNTSRTITPYNKKGEVDYFRLNLADFNILEEYDNNYIDLELLDASVQLNLEYKFSKKLNFKTSGVIRYAYNENVHKIKEGSNVLNAYRADDNSIIRIKNKFLYQDPNKPNQEKIVVIPYGGFYLQDNNKLFNLYLKNIINYNDIFNEVHSVNLLLGNEIKSVKRENTYFNGYGYQFDKGGSVFTDINIMKSLIEANFPYFGHSVGKDKHIAVFANGGYGYKGKYIINGTIRIDGSNQLGKSRTARYLPTWNISGKYNLSEESFMQGLPVLSFAAVRATYGLTAIMGPTPNSSVILRNDIAFRQYSHEKESELTLLALANDDLTWEKQYETNIGIDLGFFNNRISLSSDIYFRKGFDLIAPITTSAVGGKYWKWANYADMESNGVEFSLNTKNIENKNFKWNTNVTFSYISNTITNLDSKPQIFDMVRAEGGPREGYPVRALFSIPFAGLNEKGLPQFYNKDGEKVIGGIDFQSNEIDFLKYEGPVNPTVTGGVSNNFKYKNFDFKVFTSYSFGNVVRLTPTFRAIHNDWSSVSKDMKNRWMLPGDETKTNIPAIPSRELYNNTDKLSVAYNAYNYSDQRVAKGDFIRLKEVSIRYTLPKKYTHKLGLEKLSFKGQATNLLLLYSDKKLNGQDPEFFGAGGVALPVSRQFTFTVKLTM